MLILLSPAKNQDFTNPAPVQDYSDISFPTDTAELVTELKKYSPEKLGDLMSISPKLSELNYQRFHDFNTDKSPTKQVLFAFQGDAYKSLNAASLSGDDIAFAQQHLVMLSGLYGLLRPLDLIHAYRLEMKTKLANPKGKDLYQFWGDKLTKQLNTWLANTENNTVINLASGEYSKAIDFKQISGQVITIDFKELKDDQYKTIGLFAKRARGAMARYIICHQITEPKSLENFAELGYKYNPELSISNKMVFCR